MKTKNMKIQLVWLLFILILSAFVLSKIIQSDFEKALPLSKGTRVLKQEELSLEGKDCITINCCYENIHITFSDSIDKISILEKAYAKTDEKNLYSVNSEGSELIINGMAEDANINENVLTLYFSIPASYKEKIELFAEYGNIEIFQNANLADFSCSQKYGNFTWAGELSADTCTIHSTLGNCKIDSIISDNYSITSDIGNVQIDSPKQ